MGGAEHQLFADAVHHIVQGEEPLLLRHSGVENHLEQHIPQLLLEVSGVLLVDGFHRLIGLLQHVPPDALVGLLPIPGTAARLAQQRHDPVQVLEAVSFHTLKIYHSFSSSARYFH